MQGSIQLEGGDGGILKSVFSKGIIKKMIEAVLESRNFNGVMAQIGGLVTVST